MKGQLTSACLQKRVEFDRLPVIIGRDSSADIQIDDVTLPPLQCMIGHQADGRMVIWNLRNDFPLYLNGNPVIKAELFPGDLLSIGQSHFVLSCEAVETGSRCSGTARQERAALLPVG